MVGYIVVIKVITIIACAILFRWGGASFKQARVSIMPFILGLVCAYFAHCWWIFFTTFAGGQFLRLGYGESSFLYRLFGSWLARGVYCLIIAFACVVGLVIGQKVPILLAIPYLVTNFAIGSLLCKLEMPVWVIDPCLGIGISSIVFYI